MATQSTFPISFVFTQPHKKQAIHPLDFDSHCTFCLKNRNEVKNLIGVPKAWICNECVDLLNEMIAEEDKEKAGKND